MMLPSIVKAMATAAVLSGASAEPSAQAGIVVLPPALDEASRVAAPHLLEDYILTAVQQVAPGRVIGRSDIDAMLGMERQRDLLGCEDTSCFAELGGALGVERVLQMHVAQTEDGWVVTGKIINTRRAVVEKRASRIAGAGSNELLSASRSVVDRLFGIFAADESEAEGPPKRQTAQAEISLRLFLDVGLSPTQHEDFVASGHPYGVWARVDNERSEWWSLEITKWTFTVFAGLGLLNIPIQMPRGTWDRGDWSMLGFFAAGSAVFWALDLADLGNAPLELAD